MSGPRLAVPHYGPRAERITVRHITDPHIDGGVVRAKVDGRSVTRWMGWKRDHEGNKVAPDRLGTAVRVLGDALAGEWDG